MIKDTRGKETGMVIVEATIILPIAILSMILLLYLSLILFQKANLQAGLETTLVYYKNSLRDTFVTQNDELEFDKSDSEEWIAAGNSYVAEEPLNPYRGIFGVSGSIEDEEDFRKYFDSVAGGMLFDDDIQFEIDYSNYVVYKQIKVSAVQNIKLPINFSILGIGDTFPITAAAKVNVVDHDGLIRDADYAIDLIEDTKIGEYARDFGSKIAELYNKMKTKLGVK